MTAKGMSSISVSYETRRQLNTMRTMNGYKSVDLLLADLIREHKTKKMRGELDNLRTSMKEIADVNVNHLIDRLNLAPFKV